MLRDGRVDLVIGGRAIIPRRALDVAFSDSYTHHSVAFIVGDASVYDGGAKCLPLPYFGDDLLF